MLKNEKRLWERLIKISKDYRIVPFKSSKVHVKPEEMLRHFKMIKRYIENKQKADSKP